MLSALIIFAVSTHASAELRQVEDVTITKPYQLLLAGGALNTCSSFSKDNCRRESFSKSAKTGLLYELNTSAIKRLEKFGQTAPSDVAQLLAELRPELLAILDRKNISKVLTRQELFDVFAINNVLAKVENLPDAAYFALIDHLEYAQFDTNAARKKEQADVVNTTNRHSKEIYQRFVDEVKKIAKQNGQTPQILVATSSSRDAFEVADFYESVFTSLGVTTTWIPIDQTFARALALSASNRRVCGQLDQIAMQFNRFDRARVYPDRAAQQQSMCESPKVLQTLIANSQGIFFNGGDQSRTLGSLVDTDHQPLAFWQQVKDLVERHKMIVGGTSAGTAVQAGIVFNQQPIPMISNGSSEQAIKRGAFAASAPSQRCDDTNCGGAIGPDDLTYVPTGGSGLFQIGTLDTHFSERDREGRLIVLALNSGARLAAGVDETTALLYRQNASQVDLEVIGAGGVFFVDGHEYLNQQTMSAGQLRAQYAGISHYLFAGIQASLNLQNAQWTMLSNSVAIAESKTLKSSNTGVWRNSTRKYCGSREMTSWTVDGVLYVLSPQPQTQFFIDTEDMHCGYLNLPFLVSYLQQPEANQ